MISWMVATIYTSLRHTGSFFLFNALRLRAHFQTSQTRPGSSSQSPSPAPTPPKWIFYDCHLFFFFSECDPNPHKFQFGVCASIAFLEMLGLLGETRNRRCKLNNKTTDGDQLVVAFLGNKFWRLLFFCWLRCRTMAHLKGALGACLGRVG